MEVSCDFRQYADYQVVEHIVLTHNDLKAVNTEVNPNNVIPRIGGNSKMDDGRFTTILNKQSWNVIRLKK